MQRVFLAAVGLAAAAWAQPESLALPPLFRQSVDALLSAEDAYRGGEYARARNILDAFWRLHPRGGAEWARAMADAQRLSADGVHFGNPPCYYALRMLDECVRWRLAAPAATQKTIHWTVVLAGGARGAGFVDEATYLFREYVAAITGGRLRVELELLPLPAVALPTESTTRTLPIAGADRELRFGGLAPAALAKLWTAVPAGVRARTDWWWVLYPSVAPAEGESITGGMNTGPDGASPAFVIDDLWLIRVPPHLGRGEYTSAERRAYLPQWLQHEFFHHLYREWPALRLETASHQWFDRATWPPDFEGLLEPDYYAESLHKRLQSATPPLWAALRYAPPPAALWARLAPRMLRGRYRVEPKRTAWDEGVIDWDTAPALRWTNEDHASWRLQPDLKNGVLATDFVNPFYSQDPAFHVVLRRGADGEYLPDVAGFRFRGQFYAKIAPLP